mmetsp:Transcript_85608/g.151604  ORF Transcript_85608/g.151604 Transcript_85608/m.151604 type:complete len:94 (-) Transcript_85608:577-858(-)
MVTDLMPAGAIAGELVILVGPGRDDLLTCGVALAGHGVVQRLPACMGVSARTAELAKPIRRECEGSGEAAGACSTASSSLALMWPRELLGSIG